MADIRPRRPDHNSTASSPLSVHRGERSPKPFAPQAEYAVQGSAIRTPDFTLRDLYLMSQKPELRPPQFI